MNDYAIGMSLFMMTVLFTFTFLGSISAPYETTGDDGESIRADRAGNRLIGHYFIASPHGRQPTSLNATCTEAFFRNATHQGCPYKPETLDETLELQPGDGLYVSVLEMNGTVTTYNGTLLKRGRAPYKNTSSTIEERVVYLNGKARILKVVIR